jgi:hypothetical protein
MGLFLGSFITTGYKNMTLTFAISVFPSVYLSAFHILKTDEQSSMIFDFEDVY